MKHSHPAGSTIICSNRFTSNHLVGACLIKNHSAQNASYELFERVGESWQSNQNIFTNVHHPLDGWGNLWGFYYLLPLFLRSLYLSQALVGETVLNGEKPYRQRTLSNACHFHCCWLFCAHDDHDHDHERRTREKRAVKWQVWRNVQSSSLRTIAVVRCCGSPLTLWWSWCELLRAELGLGVSIIHWSAGAKL